MYNELYEQSGSDIIRQLGRRYSDYRKHVGLGISAGILSGYMDNKMKDNRSNTYDPHFCDNFDVTRFNVLAGLRYCF